MDIIKTSIEGLVIIQPKVIEDERGYFMESYKESFINEKFPDIKFIQDNESKSSYGVLRGLHFQTNPCSQGKLVRCIFGEVYANPFKMLTSTPPISAPMSRPSSHFQLVACSGNIPICPNSDKFKLKKMLS